MSVASVASLANSLPAASGTDSSRTVPYDNKTATCTANHHGQDAVSASFTRRRCAQGGARSLRASQCTQIKDFLITASTKTQLPHRRPAQDGSLSLRPSAPQIKDFLIATDHDKRDLVR
ncbi:hypothetical protein M422DRAFT_265060 [Sphaerobolus stellatus SS14]|uniref:Uncharacterized protein n=1 Tax=Sphaerobolus stellatus (strain SS14) TaxID=990650 RepID=A0A0C9UUU3_SPHS4|nr:hypothetical protein M422DRAFT_265060 [Sphaerobolus stellatus SS14]